MKDITIFNRTNFFRVMEGIMKSKPKAIQVILYRMPNSRFNFVINPDGIFYIHVNYTSVFLMNIDYSEKTSNFTQSISNSLYKLIIAFYTPTVKYSICFDFKNINMLSFLANKLSKRYKEHKLILPELEVLL